jgi:hypothetical protein
LTPNGSQVPTPMLSDCVCPPLPLQVLILVAETGAGKTTQVPQYLHEAGYSKLGKVGSFGRFSNTENLHRLAKKGIPTPCVMCVCVWGGGGGVTQDGGLEVATERQGVKGMREALTPWREPLWLIGPLAC